MKKVAAKAPPFRGYSDEQWAEITSLISPNICLVGRCLRDRLEQLGRNYVWMRSGDPDSLEFFVAKEKQAVEFRRQIVEDGRFPFELQQCAAEALGKLERFCQNRTALLVKGYGLKIQSTEGGRNYTRPREKNAQSPILDCYFFSLVEVWVDRLGGKWLQKNINEFVAACARPVAGPKSTTERAVGDRLYRLYRRLSEKPKFDEFAYAVRCTWEMLEANTPWSTDEDIWLVANSVRKGLL